MGADRVYMHGRASLGKHLGVETNATQRAKDRARLARRRKAYREKLAKIDFNANFGSRDLELKTLARELLTVDAAKL